MLNINLIVLLSIIVFYFPNLAQTNYPLNSTEIGTNNGLIFEKELEYRWEEGSYTDVIQLISLSDTLQALQFRFLVNKATDDSTILIFQDIQKGSDIIDPNWNLDYYVFKDSILPNGASQDEIYVLLYNLNQNGGLLPGDHNILLEINYQVADLPDLQNNIKSSMKISHAEASTFEGLPIVITPSRDEFKICKE